MKRMNHYKFSILCISLLLGSCATSPTGQTQLKLFPDSEIAKMGITAYDEVKKTTPVSKDKNANAYVMCVANAVTRVVPANIKWEVNLFDDEAVNAFALPGGKIGVYTGLLKVAGNQDQLAAVIGHEIAHVIADHGNARVSAAFATQTGLQLAQILAGATTQQKSQLIGLLGLGAQYGILMPYGRGQESEADILGLEYMARAGFNPRESITLWQNMGKAGGGKEPPAILSTHPSNEQRISDLNQALPGATKIYKKARNQGIKPQCGQP